MIREVRAEDAAAICRIYNHYIEHSVISFETEPVGEAEMRNRIATVQTDYPWLVWEADGELLAYAYATRWKARDAYRHTAEVTVYLDHGVGRRGIGCSLYTELLGQLRERGVHVAIAVVALPNAGSVALHEAMGFEKAAHFREVGRKFDRWVDVGYWQLLLD